MGTCPFAAAFAAGVGDNLAGTLTLRTGRDHLEKSAQSGPLNLSAAAAGGAASGGFAFGSAGAAALLTGILTGEFNSFFGAVGDLFQRQFDGGFEVIAARRAVAPPPPPRATSSAENVPEHIAKDIAEDVADIIDIHVRIIMHAARRAGRHGRTGHIAAFVGCR